MPPLGKRTLGRSSATHVTGAKSSLSDKGDTDPLCLLFVGVILDVARMPWFTRRNTALQLSASGVEHLIIA